MSGRVGHLGDLGVMAVGALLARPGRAVGLMVPVAVGVATIVASFGTSASARAGLEQDLVRLGADQVHVQPVPRRGAESARLPAGAAARARLLPTARAVSARTELVDHRVQPSVVADQLAPTSAEAVVLATDTALPAAVGVGLRRGRFLETLDERRSAEVVVVGAGLARAYGIDRVGELTVLIDDRPFAVVGVLDPVVSDPVLDRALLVPFATARKRWGDDGRPGELVVRTDADDADAAARALPALVTFGDAPRPTARTAAEVLAARRHVDDTLNLLVAATGTLALALGACGMAVALGASVAVRRSEIAIRRALGATRRDITALFLLETLLIAAAAAAIGATTGPLLTALIAHQRGWPAVVDWPLAAATAVLAVELAVAAALIPARRAASLEPLTALRT